MPLDRIQRSAVEQLLKEIEEFIPDERMNNIKYNQFADRISSLGISALNPMATDASTISNDENTHMDVWLGWAGTLKQMLEESREKAPRFHVSDRVKVYGSSAIIVSQLNEGGRWRYEFVWEGSEGNIVQNWSWEEDIQPEY